MRIFLYEFVTGGGWYSYGDEPCPDSLICEGHAMVKALASDLAAIDGVSLTLLRDRRLEPLVVKDAETISVGTRFEELAAFKRCAAEAQWTNVVAPEFAGFLAQRAAIVEKVGGRLLGPSLPAIRLTSDKHATAKQLGAAGVAVPQGIAIETNDLIPESFAFPAVLKPRDGAGSQGVRLVSSPEEIEQITEPSRLERFCAGRPASVSFLCGPSGNTPLVPCCQQLSDDGRFTYLGGSLPLPPLLAERAVSLASKAIGILGTLCGYVGVDLVLGDAEDGSKDVVIEINPRLTTSYVGLRAAAKVNLAEAMLRIAEGRETSIVFDDRKVEFDTNGCVWLR
jgi:predicted ATP-grasp superfamily ATP-dependent carboligase